MQYSREVYHKTDTLIDGPLRNLGNAKDALDDLNTAIATFQAQGTGVGPDNIVAIPNAAGRAARAVIISANNGASVFMATQANDFWIDMGGGGTVNNDTENDASTVNPLTQNPGSVTIGGGTAPGAVFINNLELIVFL